MDAFIGGLQAECPRLASEAPHVGSNYFLFWENGPFTAILLHYLPYTLLWLSNLISTDTYHMDIADVSIISIRYRILPLKNRRCEQALALLNSVNYSQVEFELMVRSYPGSTLQKTPICTQ